MRIASARATPEWLSAAGAVAGIALASAAELVSHSRGVDALVLGGYVLAALVFAVTGRHVVVDDEHGSVGETSAGAAIRSATGLLTAGAVVAAVALNLAADVSVYHSLRSGGSSAVGPVLWAVSLLVLLATALAARPLPTWSAAWGSHVWPGSRLARRALVISLAVVIAGGCAARLIGLDRVPWGINADEGDRAATAMSLLSGHGTQFFFGEGWYFIPNVYFWLLAGVMKVIGIGFAQARVLGAISSVLTLCVIAWLGFRHFGGRVALLTAILGAALAVSLQFARETTEATPTAFLWALSIAFLLEAGRRGGTWPWVAAGIAGGLSVYFYPSGRLWAVLAAFVCLHLIVCARGARRRDAIAGAVVTGLAAFLAAGPFLARAQAFPHQLVLRASETSVFSDDNAARLSYYNPHWNTAQLLWAQLKHSFAIFANAGDGGGFWPTEKPILGAVLTVLVAIGLGWFTLSWRHPQRFALALWFWIGIVGMIVTVETPNLQRMATAVPVLPLLAAGVIDATASRLVRFARAAAPSAGPAAGLIVGTGAVALAVVIAVQQSHFYFATYAGMYRWPQPTIRGEAVADQGPEALVMTVGREAQVINSGWVRLLAPHVDRGSVQSPGTMLPLPLPASRDLAFELYHDQEAYLPFLRDIYPGGSIRRYTYVTEGLVVTVYRIPRERVAARAGSLAIPPLGRQVRVPGLGVVPPGPHLPATLRWSAALRVPEYWNYSLRVGPGPARLRIDGKIVLDVPAGRAWASVTVSLARGRHLVILDGVAASSTRGPSVEWRIPAAGEPLGPAGFETWRPIETSELIASTAPHGLFATVHGDGMPPQQRLDGAIATCCLTADVGADGNPYVVKWIGFLKAPRTGDYWMSLFSQGIATLQIDGRAAIRSPSPADTLIRVRVHLHAGRHTVALRYRVVGTSGGLEWIWIPPGARESIVPPSAFEPPTGAGVGPPVPLKTLSGRSAQPADIPLVVKR